MAFTFLQISNLAQAVLNGGIDASQTTLKLKSRTTGPFALPTTYDYILWIDREAVLVTADDAGVGDDRIYTITRGYEGTVAASHIDEAQAELRPSKAYFEEMQSAVNSVTGPATLPYQAVGFGDATNLLTGNVDDLTWDEVNKLLGINLQFTTYGFSPRETVDVWGNIRVEPTTLPGQDNLSHASWKTTWTGITRARVSNFPSPGSSTQAVETSYSAYVTPLNPETTIREDLITWVLHDDRENIDLIRANTSRIDIFPSVTTSGFSGLKVNNTFYVTGNAGIANSLTVSDDLDLNTQTWNVYASGGTNFIFHYANQVIEYMQVADSAGTPVDFHNFGLLFEPANDESSFISGQTGFGDVRWLLNRLGVLRFTSTGGMSWTDNTTSARLGSVYGTVDLQLDRLSAGVAQLHDGFGTLTTLRLGFLDTDTFRLRTAPTAGYILTSDGSGNGTWAAPSASGITSLNGLITTTQTFVDDTNVSMVSAGSTHTITWLSTLAIARGGTGASTAATARTNLGLQIGLDVQAWDADLDIWATKTAPSGTVLGDTDTQTLTNKTIVGTTNTVAAKSLLSATTNVDVFAAAAPTAGQVLTATSGTAATWQTPSSMGIDSLNGLTASSQTFVDDTNVSIVSAGSTHTITWLSTLPISRGGTGASTASAARTALGLQIGTDVQAWDADLDVWATKTAPSGTVVGDTDTQTLTNKTITSTTNNVAAKSLHSATTVVDVSASTAPTTGQVLTATSGTTATWQTSTGGLGNANFVDNETPSGTVDGVNDTFTLANTPTAATEHLYKNGIRQKSGAGNDYTISSATITFEAGNIPQTGDILLADYRKP